MDEDVNYVEFSMLNAKKVVYPRGGRESMKPELSQVPAIEWAQGHAMPVRGVSVESFPRVSPHGFSTRIR